MMTGETIYTLKVFWFKTMQEKQTNKQMNKQMNKQIDR